MARIGPDGPIKFRWKRSKIKRTYTYEPTQAQKGQKQGESWSLGYICDMPCWQKLQKPYKKMTFCRKYPNFWVKKAQDSCPPQIQRKFGLGKGLALFQRCEYLIIFCIWEIFCRNRYLPIFIPWQEGNEVKPGLHELPLGQPQGLSPLLVDIASDNQFTWQ